MSVIRRTSKEHEKVKKLKNRKKHPFDFVYFKKRFPHVSAWDIFEVYDKSRWILFTCNKHFKRPEKLYPDFFKFVVAVSLKLGKKDVLAHVHGGGSFYRLIKENGERFEKTA